MKGLQGCVDRGLYTSQHRVRRRDRSVSDSRGAAEILTKVMTACRSLHELPSLWLRLFLSAPDSAADSALFAAAGFAAREARRLMTLLCHRFIVMTGLQLGSFGTNVFLTMSIQSPTESQVMLRLRGVPIEEGHEDVEVYFKKADLNL